MSDEDRKIHISPSMEHGVFANAFKIQEQGKDCFLDFMLYSTKDQEAFVVARVRIRKEFLPSIKDILSQAIFMFQDDPCRDEDTNQLN